MWIPAAAAKAVVAKEAAVKAAIEEGSPAVKAAVNKEAVAPAVNKEAAAAVEASAAGPEAADDT